MPNETDNIVQEEEQIDPNEQMWKDFADGVKLKEAANAGVQVGAEPETEEVVDSETEIEVEEKEQEFLIELDDGTKLTAEEVKKGYLRQNDYSRKTKELATEREYIKENKALLDTISQNKEAQEYLIELVRGNVKGKEQKPQPERILAVPDEYANDQFVKRTVEAFNALSTELDELKNIVSGVNTSNQSRELKEKEFQAQSHLYDRLQHGYEWLRGKLGEDKIPTPEEFGNRVQEYFESQGLQPPQAAAYITGPDTEYLIDKLPRIFEKDIGKAKDTDNTGQKSKTQEKKARVLRASGKTTNAGAPTIPRKPDGSVDQDKLLTHIVQGE